jgi:hypothetical protein
MSSNRDVGSGVFGGPFYGCAAAEDDQVRQRNSLAAGSRTVELLANRVEALVHYS